MAKQPDDERLKRFMLDHFDFDALKSAGFWPKGTRRADYRTQAARVCFFFGYDSIYQYSPPEIIQFDGVNMAIVESAGTVSKEGEYQPGIRGWLSTTESFFNCPACTCPQERTTTTGKQQCEGCKRPLGVELDLTGNIHVWEL